MSGSAAELSGASAECRDADPGGLGSEREVGLPDRCGAERFGTLGGVGELERDPPELVARAGSEVRRRAQRAKEERHACQPPVGPTGIRGRTASGSVTCSRQERQ